MEKNIIRKEKKKKTRIHHFTSFLFVLYFLRPVDHIDTLTALLLLEFVDLRDCYFVLILAYKSS